MSVDPEETDEEELAAQFVGQLYDLFVEHRGLVLTLWASDSMSEEELAEAGIADINRALTVLGRIGAEGMDIRGMRSARSDLVARSTVAMIAGMAAFRSTFFGARRPSRKAHRRRADAGHPPRLPAPRPLTAAARYCAGNATDFTSRYCSKPAMPFCRPTPLAL